MYYYEQPRLRLGVAPHRRDSFAAPEFKELKAQIDKKVKKLAKECDITVIGTDKLKFPEKTLTWGKHSFVQPADILMTDYSDATQVAEYFKAQKVDALFLPFCNFGQEEAVAKVAKELNVPVLIWGPRDPAPDGEKGRPLDTQCGIFAATKVLQRYGITFTYIENCDIDDPAFANGFKEFIKTAQIVKAFRHARILQFSVRPQQFMSVIANEGELLEKFGIEVVPITASALFGQVYSLLENNDPGIDEIVADIEKTIDMSALVDKRKLAAVELGFIKMAQKYGASAIAVECWESISSEFGFSPCFILGDLNDRGIPAACELDIHGAISLLMGTAGSCFKTPAFIADLTIRHPEDDNVELLWHCGPFAKSLKKDGASGRIVKSGQGYYPIENGEMTLVRFDGVQGKYNLFVGKGEAVDGPVTNGNYCWLKVDDWVKWEKKFVYGPYIHHVVGVYGDHVAAFQDACRYLGLFYDTPDTPNF